MGGWKFASDSQNKTQLNKKQKKCVIFLKNKYERLLNFKNRNISPLLLLKPLYSWQDVAKNVELLPSKNLNKKRTVFTDIYKDIACAVLM